MIVAVRSIGPLAAALGGKRVEVELPAGTEVADLLDRLAKRSPPAAGLLGAGGRSPAQVFRAGRSLGPADPLQAGDEVDLVLAVAGG
ncbi:MAG: MoaD/ThiS family protein [Planctomycetota bacterium]